MHKKLHIFPYIVLRKYGKVFFFVLIRSLIKSNCNYFLYKLCHWLNWMIRFFLNLTFWGGGPSSNPFVFIEPVCTVWSWSMSSDNWVDKVNCSYVVISHTQVWTRQVGDLLASLIKHQTWIERLVHSKKLRWQLISSYTFANWSNSLKTLLVEQSWLDIRRTLTN